MQTSSFPADELYVPETRFGIWFLQTEIWAEHVLERAIKDLSRLMGDARPERPTIVDIGCGSGRSFTLLQRYFEAGRLIGLDIDPDMLDTARTEVSRHGLEVEFKQGNSSFLTLPDESVDIVFCHQTFHHLVAQEQALAEFHRVLRPGGYLLFAESTRAYIHSWLIRLLFRHPMDVQRTAEEYIDMVRTAGFHVSPEHISLPYLWWSRTDLGLSERLLGLRPSPDREETLLNMIGIKR